MVGQKVKMLSSVESQIDVSFLSKGNYYVLQVIRERGSFTRF
jgi:hypothetical protein